MAEVKIKKINIKIDKKSISLSLEQAKELKGALDNLFQKDAYYPYYPSYPVFQPYYMGDYQWSYTTNDTDTSGGTVSLKIQSS